MLFDVFWSSIAPKAISKGSSKTDCGVNNRPIIDPKASKEAS